MVENKCAFVAAAIVVAHAGLRPADETSIAEDHPRLLLAGDETVPENAKGSGGEITIVGRLSRVAIRDKRKNNGRGSYQQNGHRNCRDHPITRTVARPRRVPIRLRAGHGVLLSCAGNSM